MAVVETYGGTFADLGVIKKELTDASVGLQQDGSRNDLSLIKSVPSWSWTLPPRLQERRL